jgi:hypothetical protein
MSEPSSLSELIDTAVVDLDSRTANAVRSALLGTYKLGAAVMRRQMLEYLTTKHEIVESGLIDLRVEGTDES